MTAITEAAIKKYWVVGVAVAATAIWATTIYADVAALKAGMSELRSSSRETASEVRLLREAMIRAGTAFDPPKGD